jgi:intracellular sulfur oxidation DsrE/DsrF family protein
MSAADLSDTLLVVASAGLGDAEPALGQRVLGTYFRALVEMGMKPIAVACYTAGVTMVADDSPVLADLRALADSGVPVIACRTCLDHYGLADRVAVGEIGNMAQIIELQARAAKVIRL